MVLFSVKTRCKKPLQTIPMLSAMTPQFTRFPEEAP
ncbi:hypothetical protein AOG1_26650 [Geobacter sp. AOG1]|nr:hypothetical protein AOG1_26650 [Geobacter sp. AOG1]